MDGQQQPSWRPTRRQLLWTGGIVAVLAVAVLVGYRYGISLWDWIKLLIVPAVIAGGGLWFNRQQRERELEIAREQREQELGIAERRTEDEALQAYLDQMSDMLIPNKDQPSLYKARPGDSLSSVARARTLTVLLRLGDVRKARVVQFLHESGLIVKNHPILALREANLTRAHLVNARLSGADLSGAFLVGADLSGANLSGANLSGANLSGAALEFLTDLAGADLRFAELSGAGLRSANLSGANLSGAGLGNTDLEGADLGGADLSGADLGSALGWTDDQLSAAKSLEGAHMPGQKYEDWLKDKEGREEDGAKTNPS